MKVMIDREMFQSAISAVQPVIPSRTPKPVLQYVKFTASPDGSTVQATDLEVGITAKVMGMKVDTPGAALLPPQRTQQILQRSSDDELMMELVGSEVVIRGHRSKWNLATEDPDHFPDVKGLPADAALVIMSSDDLRRAIKRTIFATDPDSTRYALAGVLFESAAESLTLAASDGRRLAQQVIPAEGTDKPPKHQPVLPVKALKLVERNLDNDEQAKVCLADNSCALFDTGRAVVYTRLVEGRFPSFRDHFPSSFDVRVPLPEVSALLSAVEQAYITTAKESRGIDIDLKPGLLRLSAVSADVGSSDIEEPVNHDGPEVLFCLDGQYLLDGLRNLSPEQSITLELIDPKNPVVIRTEDQYQYVIMPMARD